ncbi:HAD family hydrolase [Mycobacterium cookii]|uniref:Haloacid dehalogenase n=1 Tax=Mycobacterium cookii TaxID=1775 RepID=A0A7I7KR15_9MYCO|nr:HAD family hydrolase [Mycobacterium cookii]MCV7332015.1 haloacid dehalogenase-like hydrolase [Mycobacterium cookii]BBX44139.1 haloacid dehalogenase [Mycobacterium cookii]
MQRDDPLPSWRAGGTRDALEEFLAAAEQVPIADRVAYFDNDGTLWCERPSYVQLDFFLDSLRKRVAVDPSIGERAEFAALLTGDQAGVAEIGLEHVALALAGLFDCMTPEEFASAAREFMSGAAHATLGRPIRSVTYQPMLELVAELRRRDFTVGIVTGGGTEFVRAISDGLYGVPAELVVGTLIGYDVSRDGQGPPVIRRNSGLLGVANEGSAKVANIQTQLGRRPILAAGNSGGDREMLEWAQATGFPSLALLIDHDDAEREFQYTSTAQTFAETEPITDVGARLGWTVVSMARDWEVIFPAVP